MTYPEQKLSDELGKLDKNIRSIELEIHFLGVQLHLLDVHKEERINECKKDLAVQVNRKEQILAVLDLIKRYQYEGVEA